MFNLAGMTKQKHTGSAGFSLIEVMVSMVIVGIIAIVSARSFVSMKHSEVSLREADVCKSYLNSAFKNIDMYGVMPMMVDMATVPHTGQPALASRFGNIKNAPMAKVFPLNASQLVVYTDSSLGLSQLNTPVLLGGTIAMLNGLYNQNASVCAATIEYNGINQIIQAQPPGLLASAPFKLEMVIEPFDIMTGIVSAGCTPQTGRTLAPKGLAPVGIVAQQTTASPGGAVAIYNTTIDNNTGFRVTLNSQFTTGDGRIHSCSDAHKYSYPADFTMVNPPTGALSVAATSTMTPAYGPDWAKLHLDYTGKPGTVLFCRDISTTSNTNNNPLNANVGNPTYIPLDKPPGKIYGPCETVTLCGKTPKRGGLFPATFTRPNASDPTTFTMDSMWTNQGMTNQGNQVPPWGCVPKIETVAVDISGNVSTPTTIVLPLLGALQDCGGSWSACVPNTNTCGVGAGKHTYTINWPAQYGGSAATCVEPNNYTESCDLPACPAVNCAGSWSGCVATGSPTCGPGSGQETYTITTNAAYGGTACPASNGQTLSCSIGSCPPAVDCVGSWGLCTGICGTGTQTYSISTPAANGGLACSAANGASQSCALAACPVPTPVPTATATAPTPTPTPPVCAWVRTAMDTTKRFDNIVSRLPGHRAMAFLDRIMGRIPQAGACQVSCPDGYATFTEIFPQSNGSGDGLVLDAAFCSPSCAPPMPFAPPALGAQITASSCGSGNNGQVLPGMDQDTCSCATKKDGSTWTCECP